MMDSLTKMMLDLGGVLFFVLLSVEFSSSAAGNILYRNVNIAATVGLECFVDKDDIQIVWTRNRRIPVVIGTKVMGDSRVKLMMDYPRERHLHIENVKMSDAGSYECLADSQTTPLVIYNLTVLAKQNLQITSTVAIPEVTTETQEGMTTTEKETKPDRTSPEVKPTSALTDGNGVEEKLAGNKGTGVRTGYDFMVLFIVMSFGILMRF
ncbi:igLON family member 5-like isoform X2 [Pecten maximus]|uniref:igLON family member 5-like isoform X2 n=1 Tax=Pecten maximus TaxID=6579 RepID=UPI00145844A2|nr:igLON family member 5-like isoform X2 [Pecten maximus]